MLALSKKNISDLRNILSQNIFHRKRQMRGQRPVTRGAMRQRGHSEKVHLRKDQMSPLRARIQSLILASDYQDAIGLLGHTNNGQHWITCKRAQIEYNLQQKRRALCSLRQALDLPRQSCIQCFELLKHIMTDCEAFADQAKDLLPLANTCTDLPHELQSFFRKSQKSSASNNQFMESQHLQVFESMLEHYREQGAAFEKLSIVEKEKDYRIAVAKRRIKPQEVIIFFPEKQIITLELAKAHPVVKKMLRIEHLLKSPKHSILSVFLICEKALKHQSKHHMYIECLPQDLSNFPVYFGNDLMKELEGTSFLPILMRKKDDLREDFDEIQSILGDEVDCLNFDDFVWARMVVSSRIFGIQVHGVKTDALIPIADMLNHKIPKMTTWSFSEERGGFVVQNLQHEIGVGQQIFDSYGTKCNSRFFLNYGFIQPKNIHNQVTLNLKNNRERNYPRLNIRLSVNIDSQQFHQVLSFYRNIVEGKGDARELGDRKEMKFISRENQQEVWKMFCSSLKEHLKKYPTTLKTDEKKLQDKQISFSLRNCIEIRVGEKRILQFYLKMGQEMISFLDSKHPKPLKNQNYSAYLRDLDLPLIRTKNKHERRSHIAVKMD